MKRHRTLIAFFRIPTEDLFFWGRYLADRVGIYLQDAED